MSRILLMMMTVLIALSSHSTCQRITFGESQMGRPLEAYVIQGRSNKKTAILLFAQHGWEEDTAPGGGQMLVDCAYELVEHYAQNTKDLQEYQLVIVPLLNPDGLIDGTNNLPAGKKGAFGRCYQNGVDPNRDWGSFEAPETRAMRDLILEYQNSLTVFIDFHGYISQFYGSPEIGKQFGKVFGFKDRTRSGYKSSYAIGYVHSLQVPYVSMIEFSNRRSVTAKKVILALNQVFLLD